MRKGPGEFIQIPNNTLAEGDIIQLMPGHTAPSFLELLPFDITKVDGKLVLQPNDFFYDD